MGTHHGSLPRRPAAAARRDSTWQPRRRPAGWMAVGMAADTAHSLVSRGLRGPVADPNAEFHRKDEIVLV